MTVKSVPALRRSQLRKCIKNESKRQVECDGHGAGVGGSRVFSHEGGSRSRGELYSPAEGVQGGTEAECGVAPEFGDAAGLSPGKVPGGILSDEYRRGDRVCAGAEFVPDVRL